MDHIRITVYTVHNEPRVFVVDKDNFGGPLLRHENGMVRFIRTEEGYHLRWLADIPQAEITGISL
jgi:hypothetical protein